VNTLTVQEVRDQLAAYDPTGFTDISEVRRRPGKFISVELLPDANLEQVLELTHKCAMLRKELTLLTCELNKNRIALKKIKELRRTRAPNLP
jgi:hypothetical protein